MAQLSLTSYFALLLVVFLVTPLNHFCPIQPVASQATNETQRIQKICSNTLESSECFLCISADHSRDSNDTPDLIHSLLHCMYSKANLAHINADLSSQKSSVPSEKAALSECSSQLFDAENFAVDAITNMETNKYAQAWANSKAARRLVIRCAKVFLADGNLNFPPSVIAPMVQTKRLYDSMHILFQLIVPQEQ